MRHAPPMWIAMFLAASCGLEPESMPPDAMDAAVRPDAGTARTDSGPTARDASPEEDATLEDAGPIDAAPILDGSPPLDAEPSPIDSGPRDAAASDAASTCPTGSRMCGTACLPGAECCPGDTHPEACVCGEPRVCQPDGAWSTCPLPDLCAPGQTRPCRCGAGDVEETGVQTCTGGCTWGTCIGPDARPCGSCATGAGYCYADATRGEWWICESNRWVCECGCTGSAICC